MAEEKKRERRRRKKYRRKKRKDKPINPPEIEVADREAMGMELRRDGYSYSEISDRVPGWNSAGTAYAAINRALKRRERHNVDSLVKIEELRLDRLFYRLWKLCDRPYPDLFAIDRLLKVMESKRTLLGLNAPEKIQAHIKKTSVHFNITIGGETKERTPEEMDMFDEGDIIDLEELEKDVDGMDSIIPGLPEK